ncbi:hypothetical protein [Pseudofulvimonas gallinarii]|uniref:Uncharacterized protein n=1 Tax=Pseudofulvimonas gallinarii TaxID=634155 RepID=A0A4R3L7Y2_9GAMM|nr:hypothetical protein [Pseudofulvimonas gallinarii]TCS94334.1 hypothetical protein EDC25_1234 [Pseudofulvimonas gallinarii]
MTDKDPKELGKTLWAIAGLVITTEAMIAELPKKEAAADHGHGHCGGGIGGMDF